MSVRIPALVSATVAALVLSNACRFERETGDAGASPPPDDVRAAAAAGDFGAVAAYARGLSYDTLRGARDRQRLMVGKRCPPWAPGGDCRYGALARIEPQRDAYRIPDTVDLAAGRIVARLIAEDSAYAKLNLRAGDTTYWWVDRPHGRWRSVLVSSDPKRSPVIDSAAVWHPTTSDGAKREAYRWRQSIARFLWRETDEGLWVTCTMWGCCGIPDGDLF